MYKQLIDFFIESALRHKGVRYAKYQNRVFTNAQGNNGYFQFNVDTDGYFQLLKSIPNEPFTLTVNVDVLGFPTKDYSVLDCQNDALLIAIEWLYYVSKDERFLGLMSVYDYSFLCIDEFTDDKSSGVRMTVEFVIPSPLNLCTVMDNFSEEYIPEETDKELDLKDANPPSQSNDLVLRPVLLPQKK